MYRNDEQDMIGGISPRRERVRRKRKIASFFNLIYLVAMTILLLCFSATRFMSGTKKPPTQREFSKYLSSLVFDPENKENRKTAQKTTYNTQKTAQKKTAPIYYRTYSNDYFYWKTAPYDKNAYEKTIKKLNENCKENCGITCKDGSCTVERRYPGTDMTKKTVYGAEGKPESIEYCLVRNKDSLCTQGGTAYYGHDGKMSVLIKCQAYDVNGICTQNGTITNYFYDEKGNNILRKECKDEQCSRPVLVASAYNDKGKKTISDVLCINYQNGKCGSFGIGSIFEYDSEGRQKSVRTCHRFSSDMKCAEYDDFIHRFKYDEKGNCIYSDLCEKFDPITGLCSSLASANYYKYDDRKKIKNMVYCAHPDEKGKCENKTEFTYFREYDAKGNISKMLTYSLKYSSGTAEGTKKLYKRIS